MTDQPTPRPMTASQLRAVVNQIARTYLEVERGLRSPDQLAAFLSRAEYHRHRVTSRGPRAASRPVRPTDIGKVRLDAATPDRVNASVRVRRDDGTWSALVVDLKQTGHGWHVERLDRLERLLPREPRNVEIDEDAVERRRHFVERERQTVDAAYRAVRRRYDRIPDKRTTPARALRPELDRWEDRLADLDSELRDLRAAGRTESHELTHGAVDDGVPAEVDAGARSARGNDFEALVGRYRDRWGIAPDAAIFGTPVDEIQEADRRELVAAIQAAFADAPTRSFQPRFRSVDLGL